MRFIQTLINEILLAGTVLLLLFTVLMGSTNHFPFNDFYWLKADTSSIRGAPNESAWTFWGVCNVNDYSLCSLGPAYPISPVDNFSTTRNVPKKFVTNRDTFYYLTRFSFAFLIISLCFSAIALIIDILGFCFLIIDFVVIFLIMVALFFLAALAAFQTAATVLAKNAFQDANLSAKVGLKSMAILWAAVVCLGLVFLNTLWANILNSYQKHMSRVRASTTQEPIPVEQSGPVADDSSFTRSTPAAPETKEDGGGIRFFKIKRNHKTSDEESV